MSFPWTKWNFYSQKFAYMDDFSISSRFLGDIFTMFCICFACDWYAIKPIAWDASNAKQNKVLHSIYIVYNHWNESYHVAVLGPI